jgi:ribose transport system ATP-binding protein
MGSGRTELVRCIFGADKIDSGTIIVDNHKKTLNSPRAALNAGIGLLPEDRRYQGLVLVRSVQENITYPIIDKMDYFGIIKWHLLINKASEYVKKLRIKIVSLQQKVVFLSGGNQQKVVLAKWLAANCKIIILDEPTIGIDIGTKAEIYRLLIDLTRQGVGIILVSSDIQEIVGMSHRAIIMHRGMVAGELSGDEINPENIFMLSINEVGS